MRGRMMVGVAATVVAVSLAFVTTAPAALAGDPAHADLAMESQPAHGSAWSGSLVRIRLTMHNFGPGVVMTGAAVTDINLPRGIEFWNATVPSGCTELEPRRHRRCHNQVMIYPDYDNPSGVPGASPFFLDVRIVNGCTAPGEYRVEYDLDPNLSNNATPLVVSVDDVDPASCGSAAPPSGGGAADGNNGGSNTGGGNTGGGDNSGGAGNSPAGGGQAESPVAAPDPSATPSPAVVEVPDAGASASPAPVALTTADDAAQPIGSGGGRWGWALGAIGVAAAVASWLWWRRRTAGRPTTEPVVD